MRIVDTLGSERRYTRRLGIGLADAGEATVGAPPRVTALRRARRGSPRDGRRHRVGARGDGRQRRRRLTGVGCGLRGGFLLGRRRRRPRRGDLGESRGGPRAAIGEGGRVDRGSGGRPRGRTPRGAGRRCGSPRRGVRSVGDWIVRRRGDPTQLAAQVPEPAPASGRAALPLRGGGRERGVRRGGRARRRCQRHAEIARRVPAPVAEGQRG
mmetsp:Transcript_10738/g.44651  ORF Transcript_10738/g.44651 Transcript_10738/m.44651 type:complete len:211 (-) Transcript_10738:2755-3387(-)